MWRHGLYSLGSAYTVDQSCAMTVEAFSLKASWSSSTGVTSPYDCQQSQSVHQCRLLEQGVGVSSAQLNRALSSTVWTVPRQYMSLGAFCPRTRYWTSPMPRAVRQCLLPGDTHVLPPVRLSHQLPAVWQPQHTLSQCPQSHWASQMHALHKIQNLGYFW